MALKPHTEHLRRESVICTLFHNHSAKLHALTLKCSDSCHMQCTYTVCVLRVGVTMKTRVYCEVRIEPVHVS
jgi:hypothetical protein